MTARRTIPLALTLLALLAGCSSTMQTFDGRLPPDESIPTASPTPEALARYRAAAAYSEDVGGLALLVIEGGSIVFERYEEDHAPDRAVHLFSGTKSFACPLLMAALADGHIDLDEPVYHTFEAWADDPFKVTVTPRHLLSLTSGLEQDFRRLSWDGMRRRQRFDDKVAIALSLEAEAPPGETFSYGSAPFFILSALIAQEVGRDPLEYLTERVLDPIGLRTAGWQRDPKGHPMFAYGAWTTAREWARFGLFILADGAVGGRRLLPEGALTTCFQGSEAMPAYGLGFWLNRGVTAAQRQTLPQAVHTGGDGPLLSPRAPADLVAAAGHGDQRLYIIPSLDLVVVRLGEGDDDFRDAALLERLLPPRPE